MNISLSAFTSFLSPALNTHFWTKSASRTEFSSLFSILVEGGQIFSNFQKESWNEKPKGGIGKQRAERKACFADSLLLVDRLVTHNLRNGEKQEESTFIFFSALSVSIKSSSSSSLFFFNGLLFNWHPSVYPLRLSKGERERESRSPVPVLISSLSSLQP